MNENALFRIADAFEKLSDQLDRLIALQKIITETLIEIAKRIET